LAFIAGLVHAAVLVRKSLFLNNHINVVEGQFGFLATALCISR